MKILFLSPNQINRYNWGHQLFRNEIGRQHDVVYYGQGFPNFDKNWNVKEIIKKKYNGGKPDAIFTYGYRYSVGFKGLGEIDDIAKIHIVVDYGGKINRIPIQNKFFFENKYDMMFGVTSLTYDVLVDQKVCPIVEPMDFSVDTNIYKKIPGIKKRDAVLAAFTTRADIYPNRLKAIKILKKAGMRVESKRVVQKKLIESINGCKVTIASNNFVHSLSMRYTETMACGGFILADKPADMERVGFVDGKHLVIYSDLNDLVKKTKYYMKNDKERENIAIEGMKFVRKNHSCKVRVKEMTDVIKDKLGI